jgi:hypothetical protein
MTEQEAFTTYLRRYRQRTGLALEDIAAATRIRLELLAGLERNEFEGWPRGLYARAYVRNYATLVGLDPKEIVNEFCRLFPYGDRRAESTMREMAAIVASQSEWRDDGHGGVDRRRRPPTSPAPAPRGFAFGYTRFVAAARRLTARAASLTRSSTGEAPGRLRRGDHVESSR